MKISELPALTTGFSPTVDVFALVHGGVTSKVTPDAVIANYLATGTIRIGNLVVTGTMTLPVGIVGITQPQDTNNTTLATTAWVINQSGTIIPAVNGVAQAGTSLRYSRVDHIHPTDFSRAPIASPSFTGEVVMPGGAVFAQAVPDVALDLNFLAGLPAGVLLGRSTGNATYIDATGVMQMLTAGNTPRIEYDIVSHAPRGLLIEETRQNIVLNSDTVNPGASVVSSTAVPALRAAATVWQHTWPAGAANGPIWGINIPVAVGQSYAASVWVWIPSAYSVAVDGLPELDLDIGTVGTGGLRTVGTADPAKRDQWQRVVTTLFVGTGGSAIVNMLLRRQLPATGGSVWFCTCPQFETGAFASSYIPTTAAVQTRQFEWGSLPTGPWFNQNAGTVLVEFIPPPVISSAPSASLSYEIVFLDNNNANDTMGVRLTGNPKVIHVVAWVANTGTIDNVLSPSLSPGINRVAFSYTRIGALNMAGSLNSGPVNAAGTPPSLPNVVRMVIGHNRAQQLNGWIRRIRYWPRQLSSAELQSLGMPTQLSGVALDSSSIGEAVPANATFVRVKTGSVTGPTWTTGTIVPNGVEPVGSLYSRVGGGVGSTLYVSRGGGTWNAVAGV